MVNTQIGKHMRAWMADAGRRAIESLPQAEAMCSPLSINYCRLLMEMGDFASAEPLAFAIQDARIKHFSAHHVSSFAATHILGSFFFKKGMLRGDTPLLAKAAELFGIAHKGRAAVLGRTHSDTLLSLSCQGASFLYSDQLEPAGVCTIEALREQLAAEGGTQNPDTYYTMGVWAEVLWRGRNVLAAM